MDAGNKETTMELRMATIVGVALAALSGCGSPPAGGLKRAMLAVGMAEMKPATEAWLSGGSTIFVFEQYRQSDPAVRHALNIWNYSNSRDPHPVELAPGKYVGGPETNNRGTLDNYQRPDGTLIPFPFTWIDLVVTVGDEGAEQRGVENAGVGFTADVVEIDVTDVGDGRIRVSYRGLATDKSVLARGSFEAPRDLDEVFFRTKTTPAEIGN